MSSMLPPAASTAALTFSHTWRVCSLMSPIPAMLPSGRRAVIPETNTKRPVASIAVAWEKTPFGWRSLGLVIWVLGMTLVLRLLAGRFVERPRIDAELAGVAPQHGDDRGVERDAAVGALAPAPFGLARREHLRDPGRAPAGADARRRRRGGLAKGGGIAEMRDVDRNEQMRAVVRHGEVAVERAHLRAGRALRQDSAHEIDDERQPKS